MPRGRRGSWWKLGWKKQADRFLDRAAAHPASAASCMLFRGSSKSYLTVCWARQPVPLWRAGPRQAYPYSWLGPAAHPGCFAEASPAGGYAAHATAAGDGRPAGCCRVARRPAPLALEWLARQCSRATRCWRPCTVWWEARGRGTAPSGWPGPQQHGAVAPIPPTALETQAAPPRAASTGCARASTRGAWRWC